MQPSAYEIEQVGNAFVAIGYLDYSNEQLVFLNRFVRDYARNLNIQEANKLFTDNSQVIEALQILHNFTLQYHNDQDIYQQFKDEMEELTIMLNGKEEWISI